MGIGVYFSISSFIILSIMGFIFFIRKRVNNIETKIYGKLLILTLVGLALEILTCFWYVKGANLDGFLYPFVSKITSSYYMIWGGLFLLYLMHICKISDKSKKILNIINFICFIIILLLPISYEIKENSIMPTGLSIYFTYMVCLAYSVVDFVLCLIYRKQIVGSKLTPVYSLMVLGGIDIFLGIYSPSLFLIGYVYSLIVIIMYFTIENPDVKMIEQLNIAREQADKANRAKTDFLSSMSHEIRTPLNAIVGFSECINTSETLDEAKENAHDIVNASQTLLEIVNGILDISKIEAGKIEIHNSAYDAADLFDGIVKLGKGRLGEKPLDYRIHIAEDLPKTLYGDHTNLKKVVVNLLTNAIKYTDHGYVDFSVKCVNKDDVCRLIISVSDSGRGIKKEDMDKLFTKFQRLDEDKNTTIEGTGLGLAITKQLIDLMGGNIIVHSTYGEGSKFTVTLDQKISNEVVSSTNTTVVNDLDLTGKKILIVDDNKLNLKVASKILEKYKPNIDTVESGMECLDKINSGNKYDLILMDDMMPRMNGRETLERLRKIDGFKTPVVILTANAISGMEQKYLDEGFDSYLSKPIDKVALHKVLSKFLGNRKEEKEEKQSKIEETLDLSNKKLLIVDDNSLNIKVAKTILKPYNLNIEESLSGIECLEKIKNGNTYDLIFMDDMMPEKSGVDTFKELKQIDNFNTPVVILTANAIEGMKEQYLKVGFSDYLSKPIDKQELDRILNELLKNDNNDSNNEDNSNDNIDSNIKYLKDNNIDIDESLKLLGDINTYNDTLKEFYSNIKSRVLKLKEYLDNNDMNNYSIEVHALKSDSKYLGFNELADISLNHELKSKQDNIDFIKKDFNTLINKIHEVLIIVKEYLKKIN